MEIGRMLRVNETLTRLNISYNRIGSDAAADIVAACKLNNYILKVDIRGNPDFPPEYIAELRGIQVLSGI